MKRGLFTCGYFVHLQDNLISFIGYVIHMLGCQFHLVSQTSTLFLWLLYRHFITCLIIFVFFIACATPCPCCRSIWGHMRTVCVAVSVESDSPGKPFFLSLCMFSLLFWRIVHWIIVNQVSSEFCWVYTSLFKDFSCRLVVLYLFYLKHCLLSSL